MKTDMQDTVTFKSALQGLMLLGRTKEQAEQEIRENEKRKYDEMEREWWGR